MIPRTILSSIGHITLGRRYYDCDTCDQKRVPWDTWAGVGDRHISPEARRMLTLAGTTWPFDVAARRLNELCHLQTSDDTIERVCQEEGKRAQQFMNEAPAPAETFAKAEGHAEFYTDGVKINTVDGWREMRLSVAAKRPPGDPAEPAEWKKRVLPETTARVAACAIARCDRVGASWKRMSKRLGLKDSADLSVLADGAPWIWKQAQKRLSSQAQWVLDVFHVSEHLHACGKAMFGEGVEAQRWADQHVQRLIELEGPGFIKALKEQREFRTADSQRQAMDKLCSYLEDNKDSMWYRTRLKRGLAIGSGLIEGACKTMIGSRLKVNSARWRVRRAERVGALRCVEYSGQWESFWQKAA